MDFSLKTYKFLKIKNYFKKTNIVFFFHGLSSDNKNWVKIEQSFTKHNLKYYKSYNSLTHNILKNSIFKNLIFLINGPIVLIEHKNSKKINSILHRSKNMPPAMYILCVKLNNKLYVQRQLNNFTKITYKENVYHLHKVLGNFSKSLYFKLKKIKKS